MSLEVRDFTGGFIIDGCEDILVGCNKEGAILEVPLAWILEGCCIDGGGGNDTDPRFTKPELLILDVPGAYNKKLFACRDRGPYFKIFAILLLLD